MNAWISLVLIALLIGVALIGVQVMDLHLIFGVIIPYAAMIIFLAGFIFRVLSWAKSPVPFRITTTCGQQKSLSWIKNNNLESPHNSLGVISRMFLEVFFFRSLFRNTRADLKDGPKLVYGSNKLLWLGGLAFHYSFLVIFIRHFKYFAEPVPRFVSIAQFFDGFFQIGLPIVYLTDAVILGALGFLTLRRLFDARLRYLSLTADYFPLFLITGIAVTGMLMRYIPAFRVDIVQVKILGTGLLSLNPSAPEGIRTIFFVHLFLVSSLIAYFPFSKLMHLGGVFLSPSRNLANNNRMKRHINPWNPKVSTHTYKEYEDEFREVMKAADMPLEKEE